MARKPLILNRYEVLGTAGAGGFGTVRIAWDPRIQRKVAIKTIELSETDALRARLPGADAVDEPRVMPAGETADRWHGVQPWNEFLAEGDAVDRTADSPEDDEPGSAEDVQPVTALAHLPGLDEARTAAMLSDSRIVTVFDFEVRGQTAYLIMEYVEGVTLTRFLADYGDYLTLDMTAAVFDAVAGALSVAHKAGVLHLDIKPDNIIINADGQAKVTDFGLATLADASGAGTTGGGTIGYMPLEQMRRQPLDARTDEWSLASLSYEMLTGENPFRARSLAEAEKAIENAELVLPSLCWDDIDEQIDDVIFYALDPDPDRRYASIRDFAEEMDKFLGDAKQGKVQLAEIVNAELNPGQADIDDYEDDESFDDSELYRPQRPSLFERMRAMLAPKERVEEDEDALENPGSTAQRSDSIASQPRKSLSQRVPESVKAFAARVFGAAASGFLTAFALTNVSLLWVVFGSGAAYVIGAAVVVVALAGAAAPSVGALVSLLLLVVSLVSCGHPIVAAVLAVAAIVWWYFVGREGFAAGNTVLALPPAGAIGASSAIPFVAGATLPFASALATTALAALMACILAATGSDSLVNWQVFSHWEFSRVDVSANLLHLLRTPSTWATVAGWLVASGVLSFMSGFKARWVRVAGIAIAVAAVLAGTLVFAGPSPELFISVILVAAVLIFET